MKEKLKKSINFDTISQKTNKKLQNLSKRKENESKFYIDAGTTWTKILEKNKNEKKYSVIKTSKLKNFKREIAGATGHSAKLVGNEKYTNEVVSLAYGAKKHINFKKEKNFVVLDLGSRDVKFVKFENGIFFDMDWNSACASATGATVEMLLKFYNVKIENLKAVDEKYLITCGIFGLEKIMDDVSQGVAPEIAISKFVHGIAVNVYNFAKKPEKIYLSGGFCENKCFVDCLKKYCKVKCLGRFVLCDGLV